MKQAQVYSITPIISKHNTTTPEAGHTRQTPSLSGPFQKRRKVESGAEWLPGPTWRLPHAPRASLYIKRFSINVSMSFTSKLNLLNRVEDSAEAGRNIYFAGDCYSCTSTTSTLPPPLLNIVWHNTWLCGKCPPTRERVLVAQRK